MIDDARFALAILVSISHERGKSEVSQPPTSQSQASLREKRETEGGEIEKGSLAGTITDLYALQSCLDDFNDNAIAQLPVLEILSTRFFV